MPTDTQLRGPRSQSGGSRSAKQGGHVCIYQERVGSRADVPRGRGSERAQAAQRGQMVEDSNCTVGRVQGGEKRFVLRRAGSGPCCGEN